MAVAAEEVANGCEEEAWPDAGEGDEEVAVEANEEEPEEAYAEDEEMADGDAGGEAPQGDDAGEEACEGGEGGEGSDAAGGGEVFKGIIFKVGDKTGNCLIRCFKVRERFGNEAVILKSDCPEAKLHDRVIFNVAEREGQRPLATGVRVVGHVDNFVEEGTPRALGKSKVNGKAKGREANWAAVPVGKGKNKGKTKGSACMEQYYQGLVKLPRKEGQFKCFLRCEKIEELYGCSAWFPLDEKPPAVADGSLVVFTVRWGGEVGISPRAYGVAQLAWPGPSVKAAGQGHGAGAAPGVQRTITKAR